ncbi:MAG: alkaline phosphatase family protein [Candidatus Izemoplasmataceae bacterium]
MRPDYTHSIVNLTASIMNHYGETPLHPPLSILDSELKKDYDHVVLILLDGFGTNLFERHLDEDALMRTHGKTVLTSVFPSTTVAATTAVLTGKTPYESGHLGWFQYFEDEDLHYQVFTGRDYYDETKKVPVGFYDKHFKQPSFIDRINARKGGVKAKAFLPSKVDTKNGHDSFERGFQNVLDFQRGHPKTLSYLYGIEPDLSQHMYGIESAQVKREVRALDATLKTYKKKAGSNTLFIVTADHGLIDVKPINLFDYHDICSTMRALPANEPRMTSFFIKAEKQEYFMRFFNEHFSDDFDLYTRQEFLQKGLLGHGEKSPLVDATLGDFIAVAKTDKFFKLSETIIHKAHHAGPTPGEMQVPLVVFTGDEKR